MLREAEDGTRRKGLRLGGGAGIPLPGIQGALLGRAMVLTPRGLAPSASGEQSRKKKKAETKPSLGQP